MQTTRGRFEVVDRGEGTPLVLVHGFPFAAESWSGEADALSTKMRVIAPSMRGFGATPPSELGELSMDTMADDVAAILDGLGVTERVVVGGLSMGGYVAMAFARRHPRRLRALILADTRAEPDSVEARANRDRGIARVEGGELEGWVTDLLPVLLAPETRAARSELVGRVRAMAMRAAPSSVSAMLRALRDRPDARPELASISVPALMIVGAEDALTPVTASRAMVEAMPAGRASLEILPRAGHLSNLEAPAAFQAAVAAFVARV